MQWCLLGVGGTGLTRIVLVPFAIACLIEIKSETALSSCRTRGTCIVRRRAHTNLVRTRIGRCAQRQRIVVLACLTVTLGGARHTCVLVTATLNTRRIARGVVIERLRALSGGSACLAGIIYSAFALCTVARFAVRAPEVRACMKNDHGHGSEMV